MQIETIILFVILFSLEFGCGVVWLRNLFYISESGFFQEELWKIFWFSKSKSLQRETKNSPNIKEEILNFYEFPIFREFFLEGNFGSSKC